MSQSLYQYHERVLLAAGDMNPYPGEFDSFRILDIDGGSYVLVKFNDSSEQKFEEGMSISFLSLKEAVEIRNDTGTDVYITFTTSQGVVVDDRRSAASTVSVSSGDNFNEAEIDIDALAAAACLIPARDTRKSLLIDNTGSQPVYLLVSPATGTAPTGYKLAAGDAMPIDCSAAIYFYKDTTVTGQKIHYVEVYS